MRNPISHEEKILFVKRLSLYLHSGIPLQVAIELLRSDAVRAAHKRFFDSVLEEVTHGRTLEQALKLFPSLFSPFHISLVSVGEITGTLTETLAHVAVHLTQQQAIKSKIVSAMIYPIIIAVGTIGITLFLVLYAFPKIVPLFKGFHAQLPFTTRVLIGISNSFQQHGIVIGIFVALFVTIFIYMLRLRQVQQYLPRILLHVPIIGKTITLYYVAAICRMLATLLQSAVPIEQALLLTQQGIAHSGYTQSLIRVRTALSAGSTLGKEFCKEPNLYPRMLVQLVTAGEMTGTLTESLLQVAMVYEEQLEETMRSMTTLIEPVLMIGMGVIVGFVAMAIITPIYGLTQSITIH
jgi:type IV pilus assembly protein PilC